MINMKLTNEQVIKLWNEGQIVWSASLGGLGVEYEKCIQALLWEIFSTWSGEEKTYCGIQFSSEYSGHVEKIVTRLNSKYHFSGAQVGQAKSVAQQFIAHGYSYMMNKLEDGRWIKTSKELVEPEKNIAKNNGD